MKVNFYATLRPIVGQKTVEIDMPDNANVSEVIEAVVSRFPALRAELLDEHSELWPYVRIFVNGRDAKYLAEAMDTAVKPTDKVDIFPAVAGG